MEFNDSYNAFKWLKIGYDRLEIDEKLDFKILNNLVEAALKVFKFILKM